MKRAVLLVNLGSPKSTSVSDVRSYLNEFLMDGRVIDSPWLVRRLVVGLFILPFRPKRSAEAYERIWSHDPEGSPLVLSSFRLRELVAKELENEMPVALGMRYGSPSIRSALEELHSLKDRPEEIFLIPLYPHYTKSSYETVVVKVQEELAAMGWSPVLTIQPPFYNDPLYVEALGESIRPHLATPHDYLLFSYHGVPQRHLKQADATCAHCLIHPDCCSVPSAAHATCYRHHCLETTRAMVEKFQLPADKYSTSFQSRLGREPWMQPYTDEEIVRLAKSGVKRLIVVCPAFVTDCLETLEEINMAGRELFMEHGGEYFEMIPCLNEHPLWVKALAFWSREFPRKK